jgi:hypothetical protein
MKYITGLIIGVALIVISGQDLIRILADPSVQSVLSWIPGENSLYIAGDIVLIIAGSMITNWSYRKNFLNNNKYIL